MCQQKAYAGRKFLSHNEYRILATRTVSREMKRNRPEFVDLLGGMEQDYNPTCMSRIANALAAFGLAAALAGLASCEPVQNPYGVTKGTQLGSSSSFDSGSGMAAPSAAGTVAGGTIDSPQSQGLSDYLKAHSLPLVGAQVVTSSSGGKQVILFGFVASDFGKTDAEQKARHYLKDPTLVVDNRIKISPELAGGHGNSNSTVNGVPSGNAMPYDNSGADPYASTGSVQDYQNNLPPGAQAYQAQGQQVQQMQQYQQYGSGSSPSMLTMILPLLMGGGGMGSSGMTFGSGGYGGGMGGYGGGYAPSYGGYGGYPSYPSPMPSSPYGAPY